MKKALFAFIMIAFVGRSEAQITITTTDLTHSGDIYTVSTGSAFTGMDVTLTGANYNWDYSLLNFVSQTRDTIFAETATSSLLSLYYINSGFNANRSNQATHGTGATIGTINISDVWNFYYNSSASFNQPGFGAIVNGAPLPIAYTSRDIIYPFPLTSTSTNTSSFGYSIDLTTTLGIYYGVRKVRTNEVDGWGSVTTPYGTFNSLRVKSTVVEVDSFYVDSLHFGFNTPAITTIEYKWLASGKGIPVLQINTSVGGVVSQITYRDTLNTTSLAQVPTFNQELQVFPNPSNGNQTFSKMNLERASDLKFEIYTIDGKLISTESVRAANGLFIHPLNFDKNNLVNGEYLLKVTSDGGASIVKQFTIAEQ